MASQREYYVISGFADDAHIFRHGSRIVKLFKDERKIVGKTFWDLSGKDHGNNKWFIAIGKGDRTVGTCMVSPLGKNEQLLSNFLAKDTVIEKDLLRRAKEYSKGLSLVIYVDDSMKQKLKSMGALETNDPTKMIFHPYMKIST